MPEAATAEFERHRMYVGGEWVEAASGQTRESIDPYRGESWAVVPEAGVEDVHRAVRAARAAFDEGPWPRMPGKLRSRILRRLADLVRRDGNAIAKIETRDNGKLFREMSQQLAAVPDFFDYFAGAADKIQGDVVPSDKPNYLVYTVREPIGVVAAIVPWNSPVLAATYKLAPALAAGCTVVLKPSSQTPVSLLAFARLFDEAGFPPGVVNVVTGPGATVGNALVSDPGVDKVSFTGSTAAGLEIAKHAATHFARVSLELGGKSPNIVFADADLSAALNGAVAGVFAATGQTCVAGSRLLVQRPIYEEFLATFVERARRIRLGDPLRAETEMGPVAFQEQFDKVLGYIRAAQTEGATIACGGRPAAGADLGKGLFIEPTVVSDVRSDMRVAQEEIFGPVVSVIPFETEEDAIRLGNDVQYGLAAGVWTRDLGRAHRVAGRLRAGTVWVNSYRMVAPSVPSGGWKMSGYGRRNGLEGMLEYLQQKTVWIELAGATRDPFVLG